jgi:hypothetical protein
MPESAWAIASLYGQARTQLRLAVSFELEPPAEARTAAIGQSPGTGVKLDAGYLDVVYAIFDQEEDRKASPGPVLT